MISACSGIESWTLRGLMDFSERFRQPTDATTLLTPNQMSEHARRRDLIGCDTSESLSRPRVCPEGTDSQITTFGHSSTQLFQKVRVTGHHLISKVRTQQMFGLRRGESLICLPTAARVWVLFKFRYSRNQRAARCCGLKLLSAIPPTEERPQPP